MIGLSPLFDISRMSRAPSQEGAHNARVGRAYQLCGAMEPCLNDAATRPAFEDLRLR